jgi:indole-3-glycerol phosphate synthase
MPTILDEIVAHKRRELAQAKAATPESDLEARCERLPPGRGFAARLVTPGQVEVIAEVKRASPSAGVLRADFDPVAIAREYAAHGAAAISVLTDERFFQGSLQTLRLVRAAVAVPLLRKDFIVDYYQLLEARAAGADAVLLIAEVLPGEQLASLHHAARALGLEVLVELHDEDQLPRVLDVGPQMVGINNRDLRTFDVRLDHTLRLAERVPDEIILVSESGIRSQADLQRLGQAGVDAVLVGETLMRAPAIGPALAALRGVNRSP